MAAGAVSGAESDMDHAAVALLAWAYTAAGKRGKDLPIAGKFALGFAVVAIGFFVYGVAGKFADAGKTSSWVMICGLGLGHSPANHHPR